MRMNLGSYETKDSLREQEGVFGNGGSVGLVFRLGCRPMIESGPMEFSTLSGKRMGHKSCIVRKIFVYFG